MAGAPAAGANAVCVLGSPAEGRVPHAPRAPLPRSGAAAPAPGRQPWGRGPRGAEEAPSPAPEIRPLQSPLSAW